MPCCAAAVQFPPVDSKTASDRLDSAYTRAFSGAPVVHNHVYTLQVRVVASVRGTALLTSAELAVTLGRQRLAVAAQ